MALTANYIPKYKGLSGTHPQLENSTLSESGGLLSMQGRTVGVTTQTTTYTVADTKEVVICNAPATTFAVTLPAASGGGRIITVKNVNQGIAEVTPDGTDTIDGLNSAAVLGRYESVTVVDYASGKWAILY